MSELRVPTHSLAAEVLCTDGRTFRGNVFIPVASQQRSGPMGASEWMNDRSPFFPFLPDDGSGSFILNRSEVLVLTLSAVDDTEVDEEISQAAIRRHVIVELRDRRFEGDVVIEMPENLRRVADFLNRPDPFLIVEEGGRRHLIRKARITRVIEPQGK
jgi:hypothetical protein